MPGPPSPGYARPRYRLGQGKIRWIEGLHRERLGRPEVGTGECSHSGGREPVRARLLGVWGPCRDLGWIDHPWGLPSQAVKGTKMTKCQGGHPDPVEPSAAAVATLAALGIRAELVATTQHQVVFRARAQDLLVDLGGGMMEFKRVLVAGVRELTA